MKNIRDVIGGFIRKKHAALMANMFVGIIFSVFLVRENCADTLSLTRSDSYQQAIAVTYSNPTIVSNTLQVTLQIQNKSRTWVYIEQAYIEQDTSSAPKIPVSLPYTVYLLGPDGTKTLNNVAFNANYYLKFNVTTPIGLDFTTLATDPKPRALFGAMIVDCMTRGLLTFALPANAFDEPFNAATGVVEPLLDNIVSTLEKDGKALGSAAVDLKNRDWVNLSADFGELAFQIASESSSLKDSISQLLQKANIGLSSGEVGDFLDKASMWFGVITEVLNLPAKYTLLHDISISTFDAPPSSWNRFDVVVTAQSPSVSYVSPSSFTGLPIGQTRPIRIIGSGFTEGATLTFNDGVNPPHTGKVPTFVSANELDYKIDTGANPAAWTVQVINGAQTSTLGHFTVNAPTVSTPETGSLVVNLSPVSATSAGAQWQVDGTGYNSSGQVVGYLTPGLHTVAFKPISGFATPTNQIVTINANAQTTINASYTAMATTTYALTLNAANGSISPSPLGTFSGNSFLYTSGSAVQLYAGANSGYHFTGWSGGVSGAANPTPVTMDAPKTVTANFAPGDPSIGSLTITILPQGAVAAGVTWGISANDYRASGSSYTGSPGGFFFHLHTVDGWLGPATIFAAVTAGQTNNVNVIFAPDTTPGLLTVTLSPPEAVTAGAKWHVNGGSAQGDGAILPLSPGTNYSIIFDPAPGWTPPASRTVAISRAQTEIVTGNYVLPAGRPVIGAISPPIGPLTGGTLMRIKGVNFTAPATVLIGGQPATSVTVSSATEITCLTPANSVYGSTSVVLGIAGGSATNSNGFSYGLTKGSHIDFVSSVGGSESAVAIQGNNAYLGEGRNLIVLDISSPSSPSKIGYVTLPGLVRGIDLFGQYAYVADQEGGVQVVDIHNPSLPLIRGFYSPTNSSSTGIKIASGRAYVADEVSGLEILDLGNPTVPTLISSANCGTAQAVLLKGSGNVLFAYVSTGDNLCVVDVSNPFSPILRGQVSINSGFVNSIAISGDYVYAASKAGQLEIIDISNPGAPMSVGQAPSITNPYVVTTANNYVYAVNDNLGISKQKTFYVFSINGGNLSLVGQTTNTSSTGYNMVISGTHAYVAGGASGLRIVDVSSSFNPFASATFTDSGRSGYYKSVAVTGNTLCIEDYLTFKTFGIAQPSFPALGGQLSGIGGGKIVARNGIAYVQDVNATDIIDVSTPNSPQLLTSISVTTAYNSKMTVVGSTLYIVGLNTANQARLVAVDVATPSTPTVLGTKDFSSLPDANPVSVAVNGSKALVGIRSNSGNQLSILDISNISAPVEAGNVPNLNAQEIRISTDGTFAYVITFSVPSVLNVVNISDPAHPLIATNLQLDRSQATSLELRSNELYVSTGKGLYVIDITDPGVPRLTRSYSVSGVNGINVSNDSANQSDIYLATGDGGMVILREEDIEPPHIFITNPWTLPTYTNTTSTINLGGNVDDNVGVTRITWDNSRGGGGAVNSPFENWYLSGVTLYPGTNIITVTAFDAAGNSGSDALLVLYAATNQNQTLTFLSIPEHTFGDGPIPLVAAASSGFEVSFSVISGSASISNNWLILTGAGRVIVEANQSGNNSFHSATPVDMHFNVTRANQSIAFTPIPNHSAGDPPFALTGATSSGLPVDFNVISGPGITSSNMLTLLGSGTITVIAGQPGNSNYNAAATVQQSFSVSKIPQTITFGALSQQKAGDAPFPLTAMTDSGLPVNFSVSGPATLSGNIVTLTGWGMVTVTASQLGNNIYAAAAPVTQLLLVVPPDNTIGNTGFLTNGDFQMAFYGTVGSNYTLQASTDLTNWSSVFNFACTNSPTILADTNSISIRHNFYRLKQ